MAVARMESVDLSALLLIISHPKDLSDATVATFSPFSYSLRTLLEYFFRLSDSNNDSFGFFRRRLR